jgi:hypothetical protein
MRRRAVCWTRPATGGSRLARNMCALWHVRSVACCALWRPHRLLPASPPSGLLPDAPNRTCCCSTPAPHTLTPLAPVARSRLDVDEYKRHLKSGLVMLSQVRKGRVRPAPHPQPAPARSAALEAWRGPLAPTDRATPFSPPFRVSRARPASWWGSCLGCGCSEQPRTAPARTADAVPPHPAHTRAQQPCCE